MRITLLGVLAGCGKSLNRDDSPPQGLKPSLILHDLRGAKAPLYHSAAGFRDFFRSLLVGMAAALLLIYVVQRVQEANQAKAETNEQSQVNKNTDPDRNRLG